jgi:DNA-binding NarL/FixJ family response regulator
MLDEGPISKADIISKINGYDLTKRQQEVVILVIRGLSNNEIAARLNICEQTVKDYLHDVFKKMQIYSRSELTAKVLGLNLP